MLLGPHRLDDSRRDAQKAAVVSAETMAETSVVCGCARRKARGTFLDHRSNLMLELRFSTTRGGGWTF